MKKILMVLLTFVACGGGTARQQSSQQDFAEVRSDLSLENSSMDLLATSSSDLSVSVVVDFAMANAPPDMRTVPDMIMCVSYGFLCSVDAQCCFTGGVSGSCVAQGMQAKTCCIPAGHATSPGDICCPGATHGCDIHGNCACD